MPVRGPVLSPETVPSDEGGAAPHFLTGASQHDVDMHKHALRKDGMG